MVNLYVLSWQIIMRGDNSNVIIYYFLILLFLSVWHIMYDFLNYIIGMITHNY